DLAVIVLYLDITGWLSRRRQNYIAIACLDTNCLVEILHHHGAVSRFDGDAALYFIRIHRALFGFNLQLAGYRRELKGAVGRCNSQVAAYVFYANIGVGGLNDYVLRMRYI